MPENKFEFNWSEEYDMEPSESAMEKMNGGSTEICAKCDGDGVINGEPCFSCGGTGWRR